MTTLGRSAPVSFAGRLSQTIRELASMAADKPRKHAALMTLAHYVETLHHSDPRLTALHRLQEGDGFKPTAEQTKLLAYLGGTGQSHVPEPWVSVEELVSAGVEDYQRADRQQQGAQTQAAESALVAKYQQMIDAEKAKTAAVQDKLAVTRSELDQARYQASIFKRVVESDEKPKPRAKAKA